MGPRIQQLLQRSGYEMNNTEIVRERNSTLLRSVQIGPGAHLASHSGVTKALSPFVKRPRREANYFHLFRRLRMSTAKPPLSHMLPWRVEGKLSFYTQSYPELNRPALMLSAPTPNSLSQPCKIIHPMLRIYCSSGTPKIRGSSCWNLEEKCPWRSWEASV